MRFKFFDIVSFSMTERTHYDALIKAYPKLRRLAPGDVIALLSRVGDQLTWIHGLTPLDDGTNVLTSTRLRLDKGTWSVLLLKEYARKVGLSINDWSLLDQAMRRGIERTEVYGSVERTMKAVRANVVYELITQNRRAA